MQSQHLLFEPLTAAHAEELWPILATPAVLAWIEPQGNLPTLADLRAEYAARANGPVPSSLSQERWFNVAIRLKQPPSPAIGRLEATAYDGWGEVAYLLGEAWWGKGLAFEAMLWWHNYLATAAPGTEWWAAVHPMNWRSIRLLERLGYRPVEEGDRPQLQSYDPGDRCFVL
ncbi:GNAT family N-acetyltransferase [Leptolyngbya sp. KIOST-1]|uniref:GNAT family N-acetyltransferase n=1 Tax=Leptolyngbya sp. KIOST-1 TaxID=1229172 RepID=UPI00068D3336|nr:GNAT family N-acetyltransferase [Leptolyngbya sp. KIOST-1]